MVDKMSSDQPLPKIVTRADLVCNYMSNTHNKTRHLLTTGDGRIRLIDEAYSLLSDLDDSFQFREREQFNLCLNELTALPPRNKFSGGNDYLLAQQRCLDKGMV
jgi:hypothetical protein